MLLWWTEVKFFCYVSIIIATVLSGVLCWGLVTHFILVSFVLVFGCHIYLTLCGLCFSLYICTAHHSILQFPVFVYPLAYMFCSHYARQVATLPAVNKSYTFIDSRFRVMFAFSWSWNLYSLSKFMYMNWLVLISSKIKLNSLYMFAYFLYIFFIFYF